MAVRAGAAAVVAVLSLSAAAVARESDREEALRRQAAGACRFLRGVADAEADVLIGPELFGRFGGVNLGEAATNGTTIGTEKQRPRRAVNSSQGPLNRAPAGPNEADPEAR